MGLGMEIRIVLGTFILSWISGYSTHFVEKRPRLAAWKHHGLDQWVVDLRIFWMLGVDPLVKKMIRHFSDVQVVLGQVRCRYTPYRSYSHTSLNQNRF